MIDYFQGQYGNRLTFESEGTVKYNCHAWAWAGGTTYWMDPPNEKIYFTSPDNSYIGGLTNPSTATKMWYGTAVDHSAIVNASTNDLSSKWGYAP